MYRNRQEPCSNIYIYIYIYVYMYKQIDWFLCVCIYMCMDMQQVYAQCCRSSNLKLAQPNCLNLRPVQVHQRPSPAETFAESAADSWPNPKAFYTLG